MIAARQRRQDVAWVRLARYLEALEARGELVRISESVGVDGEAGAIADRLVKGGGPAVLFEQPRLPDGSIASIPLAMNLFGSPERVLLALGVDRPEQIGERLTALMKPDLPRLMKRPWEGLGLAFSALGLAPRRRRKGPAQRIVWDTPDLTCLPLPQTWPLDGGRFATLPLVVTRDPDTGTHNLGMYRAQVFSPSELGLHWQLHKHGADHAERAREARIPVAVCLGGPPELIFSAISPLPDNLDEFAFAGFLGNKRLRLARAVSQDLWVPAQADIIIEGYAVPGEHRREGPFGDHFGFYSLEGDYPVLHVTAITQRRDAVLPATIVGQPPMEDGYLGELIGRAFGPVLRFQRRDVLGVHLPLETGFHDLALVRSKQRYPRQARKTAAGLLDAGQMAFLKVLVALGPDDDEHDLERWLDAIHERVDPATDLLVLPGQVADALEPTAPWENVHDKLVIDASGIGPRDPRSADVPMRGTQRDEVPAWKHRPATAPGVDAAFVEAVVSLPGVAEARLLRPSMLVVTTTTPATVDPVLGARAEAPPGAEGHDAARFAAQLEAARAQRRHLVALRTAIWAVPGGDGLRFLFLTDADLSLHEAGARRRLLWQLFTRFEVGRDLHWEHSRVLDGSRIERGARVCWTAVAPIPHPGRAALAAADVALDDVDPTLPIRAWPATTLHAPATEAMVDERWSALGLPDLATTVQVVRWPREGLRPDQAEQRGAPEAPWPSDE